MNSIKNSVLAKFTAEFTFLEVHLFIQWLYILHDIANLIQDGIHPSS